jgi:hypothetical protein
VLGNDRVKNTLKIHVHVPYLSLTVGRFLDTIPFFNVCTRLIMLDLLIDVDKIATIIVTEKEMG